VTCGWCSARRAARRAAARPCRFGTVPEPGGWNRFAIEVTDLAGTVSDLRTQGVRFRNQVVAGVGGKQILAEDPSGNLVELFEPTMAEARLSQPPS
jgi:catechol 2,3-dioxygenase-like lactoylglutathione lyase family enzyme